MYGAMERWMSVAKGLQGALSMTECANATFTSCDPVFAGTRSNAPPRPRKHILLEGFIDRKSCIKKILILKGS